MRHACGDLESISCLEGPRTLAVDAQFQSPFDDIVLLNPRMSVARDQCPRVEIDADVDGLIAVHRPAPCV